MKKIYFLVSSLLITLASASANENDVQSNIINAYISSVNAIGKQEIHLQQLLIQINKVGDNKDVAQTIDRELVFFEKSFNSVKNIATILDNSEIDSEIKKINSSYKKLERYSTQTKFNYKKILLQNQMISSHLNTLRTLVEFEMIDKLANLEYLNHTSVQKTINNINTINKQVLKLKSYELNDAKNGFNYTNHLANEKMVLDINESINTLILNNLDDLNFDPKITTIIRLIDHINATQESDIESVTNDITLLLNELKDNSIQSIFLKQKVYEKYVIKDLSDTKNSTSKS